MSESPIPDSLLAVARKLRDGDLTAEQVTAIYLGRARSGQSVTRAFIRFEESALEQAAALDRLWRSGRVAGLLHGVPLAHKDMFYRSGVVCTGGSHLLAGYRPRVTATVLERLDQSGAVDLGGLNLSEFAGNPTGQNDSFGNVCNAWDGQRISGGSSSGSAVAVAAGYCAGSLGSDTGGSIRIPASANGVVGLRPTYGRVSRYGILPRTWSLDTVGPLARTVADCAALLQVIAGPDAKDATCHTEPVPDYLQRLDADLNGVRLGVARDFFWDGAAPEAISRLEDALSLLAGCGVEIVEVSLPDPQQMNHLANLISQVESASIHQSLLQEHGDAYPLVLRTRVETGFYVSAVTYLEALKARTWQLAEVLGSVFGRVDALATPTLLWGAPTFQEATARSAAEVRPLLARMSHNTRPFSYLGLPALSLPMGFDRNGMPLGMQLVARPYDESTILQIGHAYQGLTDWHRRRPTMDHGR